MGPVKNSREITCYSVCLALAPQTNNIASHSTTHLGTIALDTPDGFQNLGASVGPAFIESRSSILALETTQPASVAQSESAADQNYPEPEHRP
jgi:hypothetical protein